MRARALPNPIIVALAIAALLSLALLPTPTLGAKGTDIKVDLQPLITRVSPSGLGAFEATFDNDGSSTITKLSFTFRLTGGTLVGPAGCTELTDGATSCPLGNIAASSGVVLRLLAEPDADVAEVVVVGRFAADASQGNPNATKSDTWPAPRDPALTATIAVSGDGGNFFGTWQEPHGHPITGVTVGSAMRQTTTVSVPPFTEEGYPFVVGQTGLSGPVCGHASEFGDEVDLRVANGEAPGGLITVVLDYTHEAANRRNPNQVGVLHDCKPVAPCATSPAPCYTASWSSSGKPKGIRIQLFLLENGKIRGV